MRGMNQQAWEAFFRILLPEETLKAMGDDVLNSTFAYLNMQANSAQLSLIPIKVSMTSGTGVQAVYTLLNTQPDCTLEQIFQMTIGLLTKGDVQFCKPPLELYPMLTPVIQEQMQFATLAIPDQLTLITAPAENDPRGKLQMARLLMRLSPILPLAFLLMLTLITVNSIKSWLCWWGIPFVMTGSLASLIGLSGAPIFSVIFQRILISRMPIYLPTILLDYAGDLASAMVQALFSPVLWQGLLLVFLGASMAGLSYLAKSEKISTR
jgi:hypothetical protein